VLSHNNYLFDLVKGEETPIKNFGKIYIVKDDIKTMLFEVEEEARRRFNKFFLNSNKEITIKSLEKTIQKMWNEGWNPDKGNINLFSTDFGIILTIIIIDKIGGQIIFRSDENLNDLSIWWQEKKIEVFPFHKMYKRLLSKDEDDIEYFYNQIKKMIE